MPRPTEGKVLDIFRSLPGKIVMGRKPLHTCGRSIFVSTGTCTCKRLPFTVCTPDVCVCPPTNYQTPRFEATRQTFFRNNRARTTWRLAGHPMTAPKFAWLPMQSCYKRPSTSELATPLWEAAAWSDTSAPHGRIASHRRILGYKRCEIQG